MASRTQFRPGHTAPQSDGSRTITIHDVPTPEQGGGASSGDDAGASAGRGGAGVLRLRGANNASRRVVWQEGTVDNEGMGKKKSKICCIYHKPKAFDESSDEDSSSSSGSSDESDQDTDSSAFSSSSRSSSKGSEGINASKALREKRAAMEKGHDNDACDHDHSNHKHRKAKKGKRSGGRQQGGSNTMVVTETETESQEEHAPRPAPNAYERGHA